MVFPFFDLAMPYSLESTKDRSTIIESFQIFSNISSIISVQPYRLEECCNCIVSIDIFLFVCLSLHKDSHKDLVLFLSKFPPFWGKSLSHRSFDTLQFMKRLSMLSLLEQLKIQQFRFKQKFESFFCNTSIVFYFPM